MSAGGGETMCWAVPPESVDSLGMRQELVESVLVVIQAGHGHQEALNDLPGLPSVVRLRVGALQTVEGRLDRLEGNTCHVQILSILHFRLKSFAECQHSILLIWEMNSG